jgi:hypothetical protein
MNGGKFSQNFKKNQNDRKVKENYKSSFMDNPKKVKSSLNISNFTLETSFVLLRVLILYSDLNQIFIIIFNIFPAIKIVPC